MIYATKKQSESNERLMSRFKKLCQRDRLMDLKRNKHHKHKPTKKFVREAAVMRSANRKKRERAKYYS